MQIDGVGEQVVAFDAEEVWGAGGYISRIGGFEDGGQSQIWNCGVVYGDGTSRECDRVGGSESDGQKNGLQPRNHIVSIVTWNPERSQSRIEKIIFHKS